MKALTLTQPYASLVACGAKKVETRSWKTSYRGPLAIHAAKTFAGIGGMNGAWGFYFVNGVHDVLRSHFGYKSPRDLPLGAVVATVELVDVDTTWNVGQSIDNFERIYGDYGPGRYAWVLENLKRLDTPIPAKGRQGLWEWRQPR